MARRSAALAHGCSGWRSAGARANAMGRRPVPRFRKLPVEIEAVRFIAWAAPGIANFEVTPDRHPPRWLVEAMLKDQREPGAVYARPWVDLTTEREEGHRLLVRTMGREGVHEVELGHWLVRGIEGELYPVAPEIFEQTYEAVD